MTDASLTLGARAAVVVVKTEPVEPISPAPAVEKKRSGTVALERFKNILNRLITLADPSKTIFTPSFEEKLKAELDSAARELDEAETKRREKARAKLNEHKARALKRSKEAVQPIIVKIEQVTRAPKKPTTKKPTKSATKKATTTTPAGADGATPAVGTPPPVKRKRGRPPKSVEEKAATAARRAALKKLSKGGFKLDDVMKDGMIDMNSVYDMNLIGASRRRAKRDPTTLAGQALIAQDEAELAILRLTNPKATLADLDPKDESSNVFNPFDQPGSEDEDFALEAGSRTRQSNPSYRLGRLTDESKKIVDEYKKRGIDYVKEADPDSRWKYRRNRPYDPDADTAESLAKRIKLAKMKKVRPMKMEGHCTAPFPFPLPPSSTSTPLGAPFVPFPFPIEGLLPLGSTSAPFPFPVPLPVPVPAESTTSSDPNPNPEPTPASTSPRTETVPPQDQMHVSQLVNPLVSKSTQPLSQTDDYSLPELSMDTNGWPTLDAIMVAPSVKVEQEIDPFEALL